jgi:hypothetical protein
MSAVKRLQFVIEMCRVLLLDLGRRFRRTKTEAAPRSLALADVSAMGDRPGGRHEEALRAVKLAPSNITAPYIFLTILNKSDLIVVPALPPGCGTQQKKFGLMVFIILGFRAV